MNSNQKSVQKGHFVISLDFELMWGVRDVTTISQYGTNILGVQKAIPSMLAAFEKHDIRATFSTVGLLFFENKKDVLEHFPTEKPSYTDSNLSPFNGYFDLEMSDAECDDFYHFAPNLVKMIAEKGVHEIGTHTFSHYYCLEKGQTLQQFQADLEAAQNAQKRFGLPAATSLVFPRNQYNSTYINACKNNGLICFRGPERSSIYRVRSLVDERIWHRFLRLADAYLPLSGPNIYTLGEMKSAVEGIADLPSSRFLRPFSKKLAFFESLRFHRIASAMTEAAKNGKTFHLWWHPHNFGNELAANIAFLNRILSHYSKLHQQFGFQSITMSDLAKLVLNEK